MHVRVCVIYIYMYIHICTKEDNSNKQARKLSLYVNMQICKCIKV